MFCQRMFQRHDWMKWVVVDRFTLHRAGTVTENILKGEARVAIGQGFYQERECQRCGKREARCVNAE